MNKIILISIYIYIYMYEFIFENYVKIKRIEIISFK